MALKKEIVELPSNACAALEGKTLKGKKEEWNVVEKLKKKPNSTGGTFSIGYIVQNSKGIKAFMKATDIGLLVKADGQLLDHLNRATAEQSFERQILDICHGNNLDKIVTCLDYGEEAVLHNNVQDVVFFLIFEQATGDVRTQTTESNRQDMVWSMNALHNLATAIAQIHKHQISHNDIKPSNLLVFDTSLQKLADMGRATRMGSSGPFDHLSCPGQCTYAAPEQVYNYYMNSSLEKISFNYRKCSDLYLLGSMLFFFQTGQMLTPFINTVMKPEHNSVNWRGNYEDVMVYWRDAFGKSILILRESLEQKTNSFEKENNEIIELFKSLCDPDPILRGHPSNRTSVSNRYSLERYMSSFDLLRSKAQVKKSTA